MTGFTPGSARLGRGGKLVPAATSSRAAVLAARLLRTRWIDSDGTSLPLIALDLGGSRPGRTPWPGRAP